MTLVLVLPTRGPIVLALRMRVLATALVALEAEGRLGARAWFRAGCWLWLMLRLLWERILLLRTRILVLGILLLLLARRHRPLLHGDGHGWGVWVRVCANGVVGEIRKDGNSGNSGR